MNIGDDDHPEELIADLTPLIDVVFLLLIFFMVTTTFLDPERQIDVDLPKAETGNKQEESPDEIVINVTEDGRIVFQGADVDHDGLVDELKRVAQNDPETPVTIRGHRLAHHERIVEVMDACGLAGLYNLAVGTTVDEG